MKNLRFLLSFIVYMVIWFLLLIWFWIGLPQDGAMFFSIISFYFALPIASIVISCLWAKQRKMIKWLLPVFFGCMAMLLGYFTFDLANTISFHHLNIPDIETALISAIPSLVSLCISTAVMAIHKNRG